MGDMTRIWANWTRRGECRGARPRRVALVLLTCMVLASCSPAGRVEHVEGEGPLSATRGGGGQALYAPGDPRMESPEPTGQPWQASFGSSILCNHDPDAGRIVLEAADVLASSEAPPVTAEWYVRVFDRGEGSPPIDSRRGNPFGPTPWPGDIDDAIAGTEVDQSCPETLGEDARLTELILVLTADADGAWVKGATIDYTVDGRPYTLRIEWQWILCGELTTDELLGQEWYCDPSSEEE